MKRRLWIAALAMVLLSGTPASADTADTVSTGFGNGTTTVGGTSAGQGGRGPGGASGTGAGVIPILPRASRLVPDCDGNSPEPGRDVMCANASQRCADMGQEGIFMRVYQGPPGVEVPKLDQWTLTGRKCLDPDQLGAGNVFPGVSQSQMRSLPIKPQTPIIQPPGGKTLVNVRTNSYVEPASQTIPTTVIGIPVLVRVHPASYSWDYGDGGTLQTQDPGAAYPDLRTTHTYTTSGEYSITLTTTYIGEYSLDDGATWSGIEGTASVTSPAQPITVMTIDTQLVAGNN